MSFEAGLVTRAVDEQRWRTEQDPCDGRKVASTVRVGEFSFAWFSRPFPFPFPHEDHRTDDLIERVSSGLDGRG